ncbi:ABC transporter ATP-binding protein [Rhizobium laguerreae]|uniref:ABC transporter ATP-binding protein n=1 Tax=Rhizobium laguerreae TaxID=1076926 RepID=UPI001C907DC4|nr:ABC transporter ATP-binding protein [Rhizobium laguerreae]
MSSTPIATEPLFEARNLAIKFQTMRGEIAAVRGVSFEVGREKVAIVGESGSGKSTIGRAILKLLPPSARITADCLRLGGTDLLSADSKAMRAIRGRRVSMILQDPKFSLNPVLTIGNQIAEAYRVHHEASQREAMQRALQMLEAVKIRDPEHVARLYPHQVSGGMGQRVMIAMMLVPEPEMIIADEPTSALDVTVRLQVLAILDELVQARGISLIFISHDLNLVGSFCDRVLIMYGGRLVEQLAAKDLPNAQHPYTRGLLGALPRLGARRERLQILTRDPSWLQG